VPSYRVSIGVGLLHPGVDPAGVVPAAASAARELATVESSDLAVTHGEARISVRFTVADDEHALAVGQHVVAAVDRLGGTSRPTLDRRAGPRWTAVR